MRKLNLLICCIGLLPIMSCGGGSGDDDEPTGQGEFTSVPVEVSITDLALPAGTPTTVSYTLPAPPTGFTSLRIDLGETLRNANITVEP